MQTNQKKATQPDFIQIMEKFSQIDLGSTILSIALAAGFVAFGILIFRLLVSGITSIFKTIGKAKTAQGEEGKLIDKGNQK